MSSPETVDARGAGYLAGTAVGVVLNYLGPAGAFPAGSICVLTIVLVDYDPTGGGKLWAVYDVAVSNIGGTLTLISAATPAARVKYDANLTQVTGISLAISGSTLVVSTVRATTTHADQAGAMVSWSACFVP